MLCTLSLLPNLKNIEYIYLAACFLQRLKNLPLCSGLLMYASGRLAWLAEKNTGTRFSGAVTISGIN